MPAARPAASAAGAEVLSLRETIVCWSRGRHPSTGLPQRMAAAVQCPVALRPSKVIIHSVGAGGREMLGCGPVMTSSCVAMARSAVRVIVYVKQVLHCCSFHVAF